MATERHLSTDGFRLRTAAFYAVSCILIGIHLPFFPVWLQAKGFDAAQVGALLAATALLRIVSVPSATHFADRFGQLRAVIIVFAVATAFGFTALGFADAFWMIVALTAFAAFAHTPAMALLDAYALRGLKARGRAYGPVRLWGSAAFIFANLGAGLAFDLIDERQLVWLLSAASIAVVAVAVMLQPLPSLPPREATAEPLLPLWRNRHFLAIMVAASLIQSSHAVYYGFSTISWKAAGYDGVAIGALWALGVIAEILLFAVSGRLPFGPLALLLFGAAGAVLRWTIMGFDPPFWALPFLQCLHGLSFGASHLGAIGFIAQNAPEGRGATAQGYFSVMQGITLGGCMLLAGLLYERVGVQSYWAMALAAGLGGIIALSVLRTVGRRS
jgi:MFS transporter, PPP family, 3-phenylpropionic acid transporter